MRRSMTIMGKMNKTDIIEALSALGHESRLDAVCLLVERGDEGMSAGEVAEHLGIKQNTMSVHLSILHRAGLVTNVREGRVIRFFADTQNLMSVIAFLIGRLNLDASRLTQSEIKTLLSELLKGS